MKYYKLLFIPHFSPLFSRVLKLLSHASFWQRYSLPFWALVAYIGLLHSCSTPRPMYVVFRLGDVESTFQIGVAYSIFLFSRC
jgi:hypothetical protein